MIQTIIALSRGDVDRAMFMNPLAAILCAAGVLYLLYAAVVLALRLPRFRPTVSAASARAGCASARSPSSPPTGSG